MKQMRDNRFDVFKSFNPDDKKVFIQNHLKLIDEGNLGAINSLGNYYLHGEENYELAKKYYKLGVEKKYIGCIVNLADYYKDIEQNYDEMEKILQIGIDQLDTTCMRRMADYHKEITKDYDEMKRYYKTAFNNGDINGIYQLALYYKYQTKDYDRMIECLLLGIDKNSDECMYSLGCYYDDIANDYDKMKKYYLLSIGKGNPRAMFALGLYYEQKEHDFEQASKYYLMGAEKDNDQCLLGICSYYKKKGDIKNMIKYYVKLVPFKNPEAHYEIARYCLLFKNDFKKAMQYINVAKRLSYNENEIKNFLLLIEIKKNEINNKNIIEEINIAGIQNKNFDSLLEFKKYIANKLNISNGLVAIKIAASINAEMENKNPDLDIIAIAQKNTDYFDKNIDKVKDEFKDLINLDKPQTDYDNGMKFIKDNDLDKAYECFKIAIDKGNINALYSLGRYYYLEGMHNSFMMKKCLKLAIKLDDHRESKLYLCNYYGYIEYNKNQHIRYLMLSHGNNSMISYQDMTNNPYMYDPNNGDYNYTLDDNIITQINITNGEVKLIEYDDNDDQYIKYIEKI